MVALAAASALVAIAVVVIAWLSAAGGAAVNGGDSHAAGGVATVTVHSGDSLWSIAATVAPNRDPRAEVDQLRSINHLSGDVVSPGQQLRVR